MSDRSVQGRKIKCLNGSCPKVNLNHLAVKDVLVSLETFVF